MSLPKEGGQSHVQFHQARTHTVELMIKHALSQPSHGLRAICSPGSRNITINVALSQPGKQPRAICLKNPGSPTAGGSACFPASGSLSDGEAEVYGGLLSARIASWRACAVHPWVLATVSRGYRLQFAMKPPRFNGLIMSVAEGESARVLTTEIKTLLSKQAIRVVHGEESRQGFYSCYFVVPKKGGTALRPILDLRILNRHLRKYSFKMLTHKVLCQSIRPNDWFVTIDLAEAYFYIDIYPSHRKFLRFAYHSIRISNYTFRAVVSSEGFYQMCGGSPVLVEGQGHKDIVLHRLIV
ncbi:uncharacterized protein LOC124386150, partial [Tachysurus ichikawai]